MNNTNELAQFVSYDQMTTVQKQAFDARHGIKSGDREACDAALSRIENQTKATRHQIEAIGPRNAKRR